MRKPQNVNAVDEFGSACEPNVYHLFTLDIHSVRVVSVNKGIKLSVAKNHCLENTPVGYGLDNQYPGSGAGISGVCAQQELMSIPWSDCLELLCTPVEEVSLRTTWGRSS